MTLLDINRKDETIISTIEKIIENAYEYVSINRNLLNNLNVFPVPDGDTGYNMSLTIAEGLNAAKRDATDPISYLDIFSSRCMNMSRGNSGIIIARFLRGFVEVLLEHENISYQSIIKAFEKGSDYARKSMVKPKEGTMLTIIDEAYRVFSKNFNNNMPILENFVNTIDGTISKLYETPDLLPILGKGGVVDAGALGFIFFMKGILYRLEGKFPIQENEDDYRVDVREVDESLIETNKMRYCFEFTVDCNGKSGEEIKQKLIDMGDSLSVTSSKEITKIHIHTNDTESVINYVSKYGRISGMKIDDMFAQTERYTSKSNDLPEILAILPGVGFEAIYSDLNVTNFIVYEDRLPTTGEIEEKIKSLDSENIIVIVNNSNIFPSVKLCQETIKDKHISIIQSKNIAEGITALFDFNPTLSVEENVDNMTEALSLSPIFIKLAKSVKDTQFGDKLIKKNEYFTIYKDNVISTSTDLSDVILNSLVQFGVEKKNTVSLYFNKNIDENEVKQAGDNVLKRYSNIAAEVYFGGQKDSLLYITIE